MRDSSGRSRELSSHRSRVPPLDWEQISEWGGGSEVSDGRKGEHVEEQDINSEDCKIETCE